MCINIFLSGGTLLHFWASKRESFLYLCRRNGNTNTVSSNGRTRYMRALNGNEEIHEEKRGFQFAGEKSSPYLCRRNGNTNTVLPNERHEEIAAEVF